MTVVVRTADPDEDGAVFVQDQANKGAIGDDTEHELLPAPASNTTRTITAFAAEDFETPEESHSCDKDGNDTWTVSVNVSVVTLRS